MTPPAQTNVQLFNQLTARGYTASEIARIGDGYILAIALFSGLYRSSGKTFIAHAIGTASVLADQQASAAVVAAALLHSAYTLGEFGSLRRAIDERKRRRVRAAIGAQAEELIHAYASFRWDDRTVRALAEATAPPHDADRDVILMRLANEVDEYAECAALYSPSWRERCEASRALLPFCVTLADRLGEFALANKIQFVAAQTLESAAARICTVASPVSKLVAPASHAPRIHVLIRAWIDGLKARGTALNFERQERRPLR